mmetsp:Transcript_2590/g.6073  ORF Transcript_2590/g.6073 Transcript_2590/m.6073 type:complete len:467 (-) Transcript_2590:165-1565(-)|eukprot:CAMPEP_0171072240 /NCGR_PEP_ID=MMETSP0766_2-20121228/10737_1 /TAXON_ID=439317 /ORGANISM="Gambierdiscus australes, Strain CAWD 149" /LENGTH=466 /DNA_ID=CAMNT_0011528809 /DNA_START=56 /DNA_END=1456 /DNA_ORIENTATION=+
MGAHEHEAPAEDSSGLESGTDRADALLEGRQRRSEQPWRNAVVVASTSLLLAFLGTMVYAAWEGHIGGHGTAQVVSKYIGGPPVHLTFPCTPLVPDHVAGHARDGHPLIVKVLSYNLFWWNLYGKHGGNGGQAGHLIASHNNPPFDFMGMQECEDPQRVLNDAGLAADYGFIIWGTASTGTHAIAMIYRKTAWTLLDHGRDDVAEDSAASGGKYYYGRRGAQWMRLKHMDTGKTVFFMNHHGPLPLHSGGQCGGYTTAHNLVRLITNRYKKGDTVIFTGDFNAGTTSQTVQELGHFLLDAYSGVAFGGVDNIFVNLPEDNIIARTNLGRGGSDHDALGVEMRIGVDKFEYQVKYDLEDSPDPKSGVASPEKCAGLCQDDDSCKAWTWQESKKCWLSKQKPGKAKEDQKGFFSGLPVRGPSDEDFVPLTCSPIWGQCGGARWHGPTCCKQKMKCVPNGEYFSQCKPR